ncbi:hypothetical protein HDU82_003184 [Entophlyctis luteolus]|nr:hypothetical protein HDU82_003184 [Entophlyctis luteolus]
MDAPMGPSTVMLHRHQQQQQQSQEHPAAAALPPHQQQQFVPHPAFPTLHSMQPQPIQQQLPLPSKKEKRHREFMDRVELIGREFAESKERIYFEKLAAFKQELRDVQDDQQQHAGTHQEFEERIALLEFERKAAIRKAELFRNYQLECANVIYQVEKEAYDQEYLAEKQGLREKILQQLEDRRKKLKEDRDNFDVTNDFSSDSNKAIYTRKTTRAQAAKLPDDKKDGGRLKPKGKAGGGPSLQIQLKEADVQEDLSAIKRIIRG